jgi:hypothetical protein
MILRSMDARQPRASTLTGRAGTAQSIVPDIGSGTMLWALVLHLLVPKAGSHLSR